MINLLLLSANLDRRSGWGRFTDELCCELSRRPSVRSQLWIAQDSEVSRDTPYVARVRAVLPPWIPRLPPRYWPNDRWSDAYPMEADFIHCLVEFPYAISASQVFRRRGIPFGVSMHGTFAATPFGRQPDSYYYRRAMESAAFITAPSAYTARVFSEASGIRRHVEVLPNGVNLERFQGSPPFFAVRRHLAIPESAPLILGVGQLKPRKGFEVLLGAFRIVQREMPSSCLVIVGEGEYAERLQSVADKLGVSPQVRITGGVPDEHLTALYQTCDVYCHLPISIDNQFEGFGLVYLEAGACRKPVVGSRSGGAPEAIIDGETGLIVEQGNCEDAAAAILTLLRNPELAKRMGQRGYEYANANTWKTYVDRLLALYQQAVLGDAVDSKVL